MKHFKGADRRYEQISDDDPNLRRAGPRAVILKDAQFNQHRGNCPHRNCGAAEMPRSGKLNGEAVAGAVRTLHSVDSLAGFRYQATPRYNTDFA